MAVGARLLAKKQAIVKRFAAIEELAGIDVLCADTTGTLTRNKLTLGDPFAAEGITADAAIPEAALASRDAPATAREMSRDLGLGANILDVSGLGDVDPAKAAKLSRQIENAESFARVLPEHRYHLVDVLQRRGHIVGMLGGEVNDVPARKKAGCGIAVSGATDAACAAAPIVLMTPGLPIVIDAIKESRCT